MSSIIIYNPASIDSTISAAVLRLKEQAEMCPVGKSLMREYSVYIWIGVFPTEEFIKSTKGKHVGYYLDRIIPDYVMKRMTVITPPINEDEEFEIPRIDTLLWCVTYTLDSKVQVIQEAIHEFRKLSLLIKQFMDCDRMMDITSQALVWAAYQSSLRFIHVGDRQGFPSIPSPTEPHQGFKTFLKEIQNPLVRQYLDYLRNIKARIEKAISFAAIDVTGPRANLKAVLISVELEITPWVAKLVLLSYPHLACYEICGNRKIYTIHTKEKSVVDYIHRYLNKPDTGYSHQYHG